LFIRAVTPISLLAVAVAVAVASALLFAQPAKASPIFDFSFVVTGGSAGSGVVTGEILGLTNNATSAATDVVITSMPGRAPGYVPALPIDVFATLSDLEHNSFTVSDGEITSGAFIAFFGPGGQDRLQLEPGTGDLGFPGSVSFQDPENLMNSWSALDSGPSPVSYSAVQTPEPSSLVVVGMALSGLTMVRCRRSMYE